MEKYLANAKVIGYNDLEIKEGMVIPSESLVYIFLDEDEYDKVVYYTSIRKMIEEKNRVVLIGSRSSDTFKVLATLMVSMNCYDIYLVTDASEVGIKYLEAVVEREPDFCEVQNFIGGEITAYSDMAMMLFQIENLVSDGDLESLKKYIESNLRSIENMSTAIDLMKKQADLTNSDELNVKIKKLAGQLRDTESSLEDLKEKIRESNNVAGKLKESEQKSKSEKEELLHKVEELEEKLKSGSAQIVRYKEIDMAHVANKVQRVLYFKELSYVPYVRTLINSIAIYCGAAKKKVKVVVYDDNTDMYEQYTRENIKIINGRNFSNSSVAISNDSTFVVSEPNSAITQEIISREEGYDVLIIYDRMRKYSDVVSSNILTKVVITPSRYELESVMKGLNLKSSDIVITVEGSSIYEMEGLPQDFTVLDIPVIEEFRKVSGKSAETSKYKKALSSTGVRIMEKILSNANIEIQMRR